MRNGLKFEQKIKSNSKRDKKYISSFAYNCLMIMKFCVRRFKHRIRFIDLIGIH